jgi:F-type H+-transporting ATPase subunit delta
VSFVVQSGRARMLPEIADEVSRLTANARQRVVADVRTAVPLDDDAKQRLAEALSRSSGSQVEVRTTVDPGVMGGVVVTMGDTVIDGSVARRLSELRSRLSGV